MNRNYRFYAFLLTVCSAMAGCSGDQPKTVPAAPVQPKKPVMMEPFRYHKMVEVSPGEDYDIVSWGRGSSTVGSFAILHSDSAAVKFTTTTGDLDGTIVDAYNADMDMDGNPEILIQAKSNDTVNYTNIYAFEFSNGKAQKLDFPKLTKSQRKGYHGNDNFYITDGKLMRDFPIYSGDGKSAKVTGQKRKFEYGLRNNSFTVKQLSKDSTDVSIVKPVANTPVKNTSSAKSTTKKSKKAPVEKHHKKKKRRHHSEG